MASQNDSVADPRLLLPNPFTPLAFVPPEDAYTVAIGVYVLIGTFTVKWFSKTQPSVKYSKYAHKSKTRILLVVGVYLYNRNKYVTAVFFTSWLAMLGYSFSLVTAIKGANIGHTDYCTYSAPFETRDSGTGIAIFIYDTLIFLAISWRLFSISHIDNGIGKSLKVVVFGRYLPAFSKALLHDGQMYYFIHVAVLLLALTLFFSPHLPVEMKAVFPAFSTVIANIMACRVFRNVKLGLYRKREDPFQSLNITAVNINCDRTRGESNICAPLPLGHCREALNPNGSLGVSIKEHGVKEGSMVHIVRAMDNHHTDVSRTDVQRTDSDDLNDLKRNEYFV
ncbi:hypothetical protein BDQ12DRAFT_773013 [Crucibulum laeve]|uniref:Uncharacterized protein n=1 Tax=Crucibulum laeve TaxID=68775 RepID=A0A5C3LHE1_9AGAR|nr:hypothetical protein BDQ12DRAFT_773013 [Crucibulum laeve]